MVDRYWRKMAGLRSSRQVWSQPASMAFRAEVRFFVWLIITFAQMVKAVDNGERKDLWFNALVL